jgi:hypothetical protein
MQVSVTISVEILKKTRYKQIKEKTMIKKAKDPKAVPELGVGKDGYKTGGVTIEATDPFETQTVTVRGTKAMRADKKPVQAKWY